MKKIKLKHVENWMYDNLKESGGNEYYISLYDSLASYVSDASDDPDIWEYLRNVLDQYGRHLTRMLQDPDPIALLSHSSGSVDSIEYLYKSIHDNNISTSYLFSVLDNGYYMHGANELDNVLYAIEELLNNDDHKEFYSLDCLSIETDGLYIKFGAISECSIWSEIDLEMLNSLDNAGLDPHDSVLFKQTLKALALKVIESLEYNEYLPKHYFK